jgi:glutaminase
MPSASKSEVANSNAPNGPTLAHLRHIQEVIDGIYEKYKHVEDGDVATYIPELAKADPKHFGICLATVDGQVFRAGDWDKEFTIQSMCKPFAFQMALEQRGGRRNFLRRQPATRHRCVFA